MKKIIALDLNNKILYAIYLCICLSICNCTNVFAHRPSSYVDTGLISQSLNKLVDAVIDDPSSSSIDLDLSSNEDDATDLDYELAINGDDAEKKYLLALLYIHRIHGKVSIERAVKLLESAIKQGHIMAYYNLGCFYLTIKEIEKQRLAFKYLEYAANHGNLKAKHKFNVYNEIGIQKDIDITDDNLEVVGCFIALDRERNFDIQDKFGMNCEQYEESLRKINTKWQ